MNAFKAARFAVTRENQKLIKRYEQSPTNSQPKNNCAKLSAVISISIPNVKKER